MHINISFYRTAILHSSQRCCYYHGALANLDAALALDLTVNLCRFCIDLCRRRITRNASCDIQLPQNLYITVMLPIKSMLPVLVASPVIFIPAVITAVSVEAAVLVSVCSASLPRCHIHICWLLYILFYLIQ